jgi:hypothetical protein
MNDFRASASPRLSSFIDLDKSILKNDLNAKRIKRLNDVLLGNQLTFEDRVTETGLKPKEFYELVES